ncbi:MAG: anthranilate phosphoribosyltransferase [Acidobacteria bacterium]|nr:anthranilate phosphoribosyltransferase [Acidobacteriota bacterium]
MELTAHLHRLVERENLTREAAEEAMQAILEGRARAAEIAAFLVALRMKGETVDELVGFARAMRRAAEPVDPGLEGEPLLDTCGTGGDARGTFNVSTLAALVAAGAGVKVAKHGNRSISSRCGSADLLEALGVRISMTAADAARAIREVGIGFLFAPAIHTAMKHAQPVRLELKMRTVFNLLGPLTNPAGATAQLVGAASEEAAELMAGALAGLGLERGLVVHGSDGADEITTTGPTLAFEIAAGKITRRRLDPEDFGIEPAAPESLHGGDRDTNCRIAREILAGAAGPARDLVLVNAAAALVVVGRARNFRQGVAIAAESINSGAARAKTEALARFSQQAASGGERDSRGPAGAPAPRSERASR